MADPLAAAAARTCAGCGTELAAALLSCPACHRLVHGDRLRQLAAEAETGERAGEPSRALAAWREALDLLPPESAQARAIGERITALGPAAERSQAGEARPDGGSRAAWVGGAGALGLLLWKFKWVLAFVLGKLKFLFLGLTKASTVLSMLLSVGVYWTAWGWRFALLVVIAMYVHEMGHVAALRRLGIAATAPMFVPGLGAFVRMKQYPQSAREDARVGLAGPRWGLFATVAAALAFWGTGAALFGAVARFSAWLNLFNLLPVPPLDGGRGFRALARGERWGVVAAMAGAWAVTGEGLLVLLALAGAVRAAAGTPAAQRDRDAFLEYVALVLLLAALSALRVPLPGGA